MNPPFTPRTIRVARPDSAAAPSQISPQVAREAVQWLLELRARQDAPELLAEWQLWLAADPAHQQAWLRIDSVNQQLHAASSPFAAAVAQAGLHTASSAGRRRAAKALAVAVFGGGALWTIKCHTPWREMTADLRTGVGQRRSTTLADGSTLVLNTASAVNVRFGATERRLQLVAGEILMTTARDSAAPARPFLVETRHGEAHALGTQFAVRQADSSTRVAVFEGAVQIRPAHASGTPLVLHAGQQASFSAAGASAPAPADSHTGTAWTQGTLIALSMRLGDFVQELGRYTDKPLSCDPAVADLRISGSYPTGNVDAAMRSAAQALALRVEAVDRFWGPTSVRLVPASQA